MKDGNLAEFQLNFPQSLPEVRSRTGASQGSVMAVAQPIPPFGRKTAAVATRSAPVLH
jgi:hypothetical protein